MTRVGAGRREKELFQTKSVRRTENRPYVKRRAKIFEVGSYGRENPSRSRIGLSRARIDEIPVRRRLACSCEQGMAKSVDSTDEIGFPTSFEEPSCSHRLIG
jgi:hypothetical protein